MAFSATLYHPCPNVIPRLVVWLQLSQVLHPLPIVLHDLDFESLIYPKFL